MEEKGRLINAYDAVIKISGKVTPILQKHGSKPRGIYLAVLEALAECPTVEAVEVVQGQWIPIIDEPTPLRKMPMLSGYKCSICGRCEEEEEPYCNCGAKMDGITDKC